MIQEMTFICGIHTWKYMRRCTYYEGKDTFFVSANRDMSSTGYYNLLKSAQGYLGNTSGCCNYDL